MTEIRGTTSHETRAGAKAKPRVLIVDDEPQNLTIFRSAFRRELKVLTAVSGAAALGILESESEPIPVVITDQRMPNMTGAEFLERVCEQWPDCMRIVLTAYSDVEAVIDAINLGQVHRFLYKPWDRNELLHTILGAVETYDLRRRNRALTEEILNQERMAVLGRLVAGITHEVGNQLGVATLVKHLKKRYEADAFLCEKLDTIGSSLGMMERMVNELRDFSSSANRDLHRVTYPLHLAVQEAMSIARYDADVATCSVAMDLDQEVVARIHKEKIQQVLINLVKNAAQAMAGAEEGREIAVDLHRRGGGAVLRVTDRGPGIPEAIREKIWEPFFTTKQRQGTGIGLDICRQIIEAHEGRVRLESSGESGSVFEIELPIEASAAAAPSVAADGNDGDGGPAPDVL